jgi:hypothetical protein
MTHVLPTDADNSSNRPPLDGGFNTGAGPLLGNARQAPNSNIIEFPSGRAFLPDSRAKSRELSIDDREFATGCFLAIFASSVLVLVCIGFIGYRAFVS